MEHHPFTPATEKQVAFVKKLLDERVVPDERVQWITQLMECGSMDRRLTSQEIDSLMKLPKKVQPKKPSEYVVAEVGYYVDPEGEFFEVCEAKQGHKYAKKLVKHGSKFKWQFTPGAMAAFQTWQPMSAEQAAEFGHKYGVCMVCRRTLTNKTSIEAGIGPVCAGKF